MTRALIVVLMLAVGGAGLAAQAAPAKKKCPRGFTLVGKKKCKKAPPKRPSTSKAVTVKPVSGTVNGSTFSIVPNARARTATITVTIACTSAEGQAVSQKNGPSGATVKATAVVDLQQKFEGTTTDDAAGTSMSWMINGRWTAANRFEAIVNGVATQPGSDGLSASCTLPQTNAVLR